MPGLLRRLITSGVWLAWALLVTLWTPLLVVLYLLTAWWDRRRWIVGRAFRLCARAALWVNPLWSVDVSGRLPEDRRGPYVVVCNHESLADVMLVGSLPWETKWIAKRAVFWIPLLGLLMWLAGDIPVRRRDEESRARAYDRMKEWLGRGASVMVFPEGTRSRDGTLLPFRNGAFRLAIETDTPVVPMAVAGTRNAIQKGSLLLGSARAKLAILEPVPVDGYGMDRVDELRKRVRDRIKRTRDALRNSLEAES